jgi:hypothetical protein
MAGRYNLLIALAACLSIARYPPRRDDMGRYGPLLAIAGPAKFRTSGRTSHVLNKLALAFVLTAALAVPSALAQAPASKPATTETKEQKKEAEKKAKEQKKAADEKAKEQEKAAKEKTKEQQKAAKEAKAKKPATTPAAK